MTVTMDLPRFNIMVAMEIIKRHPSGQWMKKTAAHKQTKTKQHGDAESSIGCKRPALDLSE